MGSVLRTRRRLNATRQELMRVSPGVVRYDVQRLLGLKRAGFDERCRRIETEFRRSLLDRRSRLGHVRAILGERNPLAILNRGYSITRDASGRILRDAGAVSRGSDISVRLARGELEAKVQKAKP